jgi:hypothetical protein
VASSSEGANIVGIKIFRFASTSTMEVVGMTSWPALKNTRKSCREIEKQGKMEDSFRIACYHLGRVENTIS